MQVSTLQTHKSPAYANAPAVVCTKDQDTKIASFIKARFVRKVYFSEISKMKH
ncbi:hypothetical protein ZEAMMB73_Zm00001d029431 [Zea mays]|uniref:Uncharacterized protein n=1 Tax=Zea mays TaxID=4577 RepID=A0A1D6K575_MAIZE|nr:hypothetical protein ZEAMMB73_Zm00001d029431 [Zea mays]